MLSFAAIGVLSAFQTAQPAVTVVSSIGAPYAIPAFDRQRDDLPKAIASSPSGKGGFFLIRDQKVDTSVYEDAAQDLKDLKVTAIFRREAADRITAWGMDGKPIDLKISEVTEDVLPNMRDGEIAIAIQHGMSPTPLKHSSFQVNTNHPIRTLVSNNMARTWTILGTTRFAYLDVIAKATASYSLGKIDASIGAVTTLDGKTFQIESTDNKNSVNVVLNALSYGESYYLSPSYDPELLQKHNFEGISSTSSTDTGSKDRTSKSYRTMTITSSMPTDTWKGLQVTKRYTLYGYFGHIPTNPNSNP